MHLYATRVFTLRRIFLLVLALVVTACTLAPQPIVFSKPVAPGVDVVMSQELRDFKLEGRSINTGWAHQLEVPIGTDFKNVLEQQLRQWFSVVNFVDKRTAGQYPIIEIETISGDIKWTDLTVTTQVDMAAYSNTGELRTKKSITSVGEGSLGKTFFGGPFLAGNTLTEAEHKALQGIVSQMDDIIQLAMSNTSPAAMLAAAPVPKLEPSDVDLNIPVGQKAGPFDVAVIIGNGSYQARGVPDVDYALHDAQTMRKYLEKTLGYDSANILYLENATFTAMNQMFGTESNHQGKLYNFVKSGKSNVFVYYVGHGAPDLETAESYFVPVDADPHYLKTSGYRLKTFYSNLAKLPAQDLVVVIDACFSGNSQKGILFSGISPAMLKVEKEISGPKNAKIFTSGRNDQVSTWYPEKSHSLFTYYFLKGLQGGADSNRDKRLTVAEMESYLGENVPYMAGRLKNVVQEPNVSGDRKAVLAVLAN